MARKESYICAKLAIQQTLKYLKHLHLYVLFQTNNNAACLVWKGKTVACSNAIIALLEVHTKRDNVELRKPAFISASR